MNCDWVRVNRRRRCPVCNSDTWCTYNDEVVLCMRVESKHKHVLKSGETGWIHNLVEKSYYTPPKEKKPEVFINSTELINHWSTKTKAQWIAVFANKLGCNPDALRHLRCCWASEHNAWAFPMSDGYGNFIGIRLRSESGAKWAVTGSHQGIFLPFCQPQDTVYIVEGPTDTAAALSIGVYAFGRPSCSGGASHLIHAIRNRRLRNAVIVADNDDPGLRGAQMLANQMPVPTAVLVLPTKDVREFAQAGGNKLTLDSLTKGCIWSQPQQQSQSPSKNSPSRSTGTSQRSVGKSSSVTSSERSSNRSTTPAPQPC